MKRLWLLLLLAGCAPKPPSQTTVVSSPSAQPLAMFSSSSAFAEKRLEEAAAVALQSGLFLEPDTAQKCWNEESRKTVREICLLLWASGGASSTAMEEILAREAAASRVTAVASVKRKAFLSHVGFPLLLAVLEKLSTDPLWLQADAVLAWLQGNNPSFQEQEALLPHLSPNEESGPKDWQLALAARRALRPTSWLSALSPYCDPATRGEARLRCWRVVGALAGTPGFEEVRAFLPTQKDDDWILFLRTFPSIARQLEAAERTSL